MRGCWASSHLRLANVPRRALGKTESALPETLLRRLAALAALGERPTRPLRAWACTAMTAPQRAPVSWFWHKREQQPGSLSSIVTASVGSVMSPRRRAHAAEPDPKP